MRGKQLSAVAKARLSRRRPSTGSTATRTKAPLLCQGEVGDDGISFNGGLFRYDREDVREFRLGQVSSRKPRLLIRAFDASPRSDLATRDRRAGILNRHEFRQAEVS